MHPADKTEVWWGYIHQNRSVQAKRYWGPGDLKEAQQSPFVKCIVEPFHARNRDEALRIVRANKMKHFMMLGKHFGYPKCCIDWFISRFFGVVPFELTPAQDEVNNNKGFIPCPSCAEQVHTGQIKKIEDLIADRQHPLPYPQVDRKYMDEHYGC